MSRLRAGVQQFQDTLDAMPPQQDIPEIRRDLLVLGNQVIDAYLGSRTWRCSMKNGFARVSSVFNEDVTWLPGETLEAHCRSRSCMDHRAYDSKRMYSGAIRTATCGIYAWRAGMRPETSRLGGWLAAQNFIHGEVHLWGDVRIHERGYRATLARPSAFYVWEDMGKEAKMKTEVAAIQFEVPLIWLPDGPVEVAQEQFNSPRARR